MTLKGLKGQEEGVIKALVTGGAGLIGSHIVDLLLQKGWEIRILDNLEDTVHPNGKPAWIPSDAEFIHGDVRNAADVVRALDGVEVVFHQAAWGGFEPEICKYIESNITGTGRIFEALKDNPRNSVRKMVVASSQAVYGEGKYSCTDHGVQHPGMRPVAQLKKRQWEMQCPVCGNDMSPLPIDEEKPKKAASLYALTKDAQERLTIEMGKFLGIPTVALRYSLTYGPRQSIFNPYTGICSIFSTRLLNDLPPVIYEDGNQLRDFIFVEDVARANLLVMKKDEANYRILNVGTGKGTSVTGFVQLLSEKYGKDITPLMRGEFRPGDARHLFEDISLISELGFQPKVTVTNGIDRYLDWIRQQGDVKEYFTQAENRMKQAGIIQE